MFQKNNIRNYKYQKISEVNGDDFEQEIDTSSFELLNRSAKQTSEVSASEYDTVFERPIQDGESLASVSLKYRVPIADLKRANKIHKETEFYALSRLKIPVNVNSVLYEILTQENTSAQAQASNSPVNSASEEAVPFGVISINQICRDKTTRVEAKQFLDNMRNDLQNLREKCSSQKSSLEEAASSLSSPSFTPLEKNMFECSGSDWGFKWSRVLAVGGIVIVGVPLIYLYVYS